MPADRFHLGDRVVYTDPEDPRHPLAGEVIEVSEHAVRVRYDAFPATANPGLIGTDTAATVLRREASA